MRLGEFHRKVDGGDGVDKMVGEAESRSSSQQNHYHGMEIIQ